MDLLIDVLRGLLGLAVLLGICYAFSSNRKAIDWRLVGIGVSSQIVLGFLILRVDFLRNIFDYISSFFIAILSYTAEGSKFIFGDLVDKTDTFGYIFAFQILPTIVFFSALTAILYYLGILQKIIYGFAWIMKRTMRLSGPESLAAAANVFIGQTEAPLVVKPYLEKMSKSEIMCLMTGGMATIAGGVFAAYIGFLGGTDPAQMQYFATHLLTASLISAPAAIVAAKMLYPETETNVSQDLSIPKQEIGSNLLDAISNGTTDGVKLAVNVGAMLLIFTALVFMLNQILLNSVGSWTGLNEVIFEQTDGRFEGLSFTYILGLVFAPLAWIIGTPSEDILIVGQLLGQKTVINEFVAYGEIPNLVFQNPKSLIIATYALCGFANFASIGIQIGGISAIAPGQRKTLSEFGIKALIGGTVACFMTAAVAGMLIQV